MYYIKEDDIVYAICETDVQNESKDVLGRKLTEEELMIVVDALSDGIGEHIGIIYHTVLTEVLPMRMGDKF